jgi:MFS family permease
LPAIPPALKHRDFRVFWSGLALSNFGSQFTTVAMAWQIYQLTNSPFAIGLLGLARALPQMGLLLFGGLLADAVDRRRLLMVMQLLQLAVSASLAVLTVLGAVTPGVLLVAAALFAVCTGLGNPSRQAFVPNLVPREDLGSALAVINTAGKLSNIAGPAAGGVALAAAGAALCYSVDAVSWLAMLAALMVIRAQRPSGMGRPGIAFSALREGLSFMRGQPVLLAMLALDFGAGFFGGPNALLPIYARDLYHVGPQGLGILFGASAAGSFLAAAGLSVTGQPRDAGRWVLAGLAAYGVCAMAFAFSPRFPFGFAIGVVMLACMGGGDTFNAVIRTTVNQTLTPDVLRGRVSSVSNIFTSGGPQLSQVESGVTAAWWGAEMAAFVGGLMTLVFVGAVALTPGLWRFRLDRSTAQLATADA